MQAVIKYIATDGTEWTTSEKAAERDVLDAAVRELEAKLGPPVKEGRRAIDVAVIADVKAATVMLCRRLWPKESVFQHEPSEIHPMSYAGRFLSDVGGPINRLWYRFSCTNGDWEYEQPYFALHPEEYRERASM